MFSVNTSSEGIEQHIPFTVPSDLNGPEGVLLAAIVARVLNQSNSFAKQLVVAGAVYLDGVQIKAPSIRYSYEELEGKVLRAGRTVTRLLNIQH